MLVQTEALSKHYGRVAALSECTLQVERGEILGLLGPNGSGKTTLLRLLLGYLRPTSGRGLIDGLDCYSQSVEVHRRTAYLPGEARLFRQLDGRETLELFARLRERSSLVRAMQLAQRLQLDLTRKVRQMSTGMRQKLALAATLSAEAPLVILDEPTANLDPTVRRDVMQLIREARQQGRTIVFSSHVLSEVEDVCDRVLVLREGRLADNVRVGDVLRQHRIRAFLTGPLTPPPSKVAAGLHIVTTPGGEITVLTPGDLAPLLGWLAQQPLERLQIEPVGLRAVYEQHHPSSLS